jgi:DNA modification methylase
MDKLKPYYQDDSVTLYLGDCRNILPRLEKVDLVLTDPPYGIGEAAGKSKSRGKPFGKQSKRLVEATDYGNEAWDNKLFSGEQFGRCSRTALWLLSLSN